MKEITIQYKLINYSLAIVWLVNGLFCKLFNLEPRHEAIVSRILGDSYSNVITNAIGIAEVIMAIWILSGKWSKQNAIVQIIIIAIMNLLEFFLVPDLLLWGRWNAFFALLLLAVIYYKQFILYPKISMR